MKSVILRRNKLGKIFMKSLARWVVYDDYFRHLDLCYNKIGSESAKIFLDKLESNNSLVSLEMRGNPCYTEAIQK
jgi:hypothetical protein